MRNSLIDLTTVLTSSAYAAWLRDHKHLEPDDTYAEVILGVAYTLAAARLKRQYTPPQHWPAWVRWLLRDAHLYLSFGFSSAPIIIGELAQKAERKKSRRHLASRWRVTED